MAALVGLCVTAPARADDSTVSWGVDNGHTGFASGSTLGAPPLTRLWTRTLGTSVGYPLVVAGKVFASYTDSGRTGTTIVALDSVTGATIWSRPMAGWATLAYDRGRLYLTSSEGILTGVDATTGAVLWTKTLPEPFSSMRAVADDGRVYTASEWSGGDVYALNGDDGTSVWTSPTGADGWPALDDSKVYVADSYCGSASAFGRSDGKLAWSGPGCNYFGGSDLVADGTHVLVDPFILDASNGHALDTYTGTQTPAIAGSTGVFPDGKYVDARSMVTGVTKWDTALPATVTSSPVIVNNIVYVGANDGNLYALDLNTGLIVWSTSVAGLSGSTGAAGIAAGEGELLVPYAGALSAYASVGFAIADGRDVAIDSGPSGTSTSTDAQFSFHATGTGFDYRCRLDNGTWTSCTSPQSYARLGSGSHYFEVKTVASGSGADIGLAARSFGVDTNPPETTITTTIGSPSRTYYQYISFGSESGAKFECQLDGSAWASCTSQYYTGSLADGQHTFRVRAIDGVGNVDPTPAELTWTVDATTPAPHIDSAPPAKTSSGSATFYWSSTESGVTYRCSLDGATATNCTSPTSYGGLADGAHSFRVTARDGATNTNYTTYSWSIDRRAPVASITSGPGATSPTSVAFAFKSDESGSTFECALDSGGYDACSSPKSYSNLPEGQHTFAVRATDGAGNVGNAATQAWTVDTAAPDVRITSGPDSESGSATATFEFSSTASDVTGFECKLDSGSFSSCASPKTYTQLPDGQHTFYVRARDSAGNYSADASAVWTIQSGDPDTTIDGGPTGTVRTHSASFTLRSDEPSAKFECSFDGADWAACPYNLTLTNVADGGHTLSARAVDVSDNRDASPATRSWSVDTTPPETTIDVQQSGAQGNSAARFYFSADDSSASFECQLDDGAWLACTSPTSYTGLAAGSHTFRVEATDPYGNRDLSAATMSFRAERVSASGDGKGALDTPHAVADLLAGLAQKSLTPLAKKGKLAVRFTSPSAGVLRLAVTAGKVKVAGASCRYAKARTASCTLKATSKGKRVLRKPKGLKLKLSGTFVPSYGTTEAATRAVRIAR